MTECSSLQIKLISFDEFCMNRNGLLDYSLGDLNDFGAVEMSRVEVKRVKLEYDFW